MHEFVLLLHFPLIIAMSGHFPSLHCAKTQFPWSKVKKILKVWINYLIDLRSLSQGDINFRQSVVGKTWDNYCEAILPMHIKDFRQSMLPSSKQQFCNQNSLYLIERNTYKTCDWFLSCWATSFWYNLALNLENA